MPVNVKVGKTVWKTSIFPDKSTGVYVMSLKKEVRKKESIVTDKTIQFTIEIRE